MANPLFTKEESDAHEVKMRDLGLTWESRSSVEEAFKIEVVRRAQARAQEFLNALIIIVGSRGAIYFDFDEVFSKSDSKEFTDALSKNNTLETRRTLYTILRGLTEVPKSWGSSAIARFFRGVGKQKDFKYHGAGMLSSMHGWKGREAWLVCEILAGGSYRNEYSRVLMSYADVEEEIREVDPDFEVIKGIDRRAKFAGTRADRDIEFINKLCGMLEAQGLAPQPEPKAELPKKKREVKIFKSGDIIRERTLRDLPLPALVCIDVQKKTGNGKLVADTIYQVVTCFDRGGYYQGYIVGRDRTKAYSHFTDNYRKFWLNGAKYLGPWKGEILKNKKIEFKYSYKHPKYEHRWL